jgi:hypothetical protein
MVSKMKFKKLPNKTLLFILTPILLLTVSVLYFFFFSKNNYDRWYDASWPYRKAVYIQTPSQYQSSQLDILIDIDTKALIEEGKLSSDCSDLLFVNQSNREPLQYWIEEGCNESESKIWVKTLPSKSYLRTIYMYYGNENAVRSDKKWDIEEIDLEQVTVALGGEEVADVLGTTGSGPSQPSSPEVEGRTNPSDLGTSTPSFKTTFEHPDYP